ncbi:MAG TPA: DUF2231 domain-containing protein [Gammaproteobacteria bacterium]|nr:DUF2231 domain-containing protein [Gammaproteobacteria bacterium]
MPEIIPNLHPVFVHFTVALVSVSIGLFVALLLFGPVLPESLRRQLGVVARWNLWFGAAITLVTVAAGFYAYNTVAHDGPSHAAMTEHRNWALAAATLIIGAAIWSIVRTRAGKSAGGWFIALLLITQLLLSTAAWHGGEIVYRYGLGVMSLPQSGGEGHDHSHGAGDGHGGEHGADETARHNEPMDFSGLEEEMESDGHNHEH